MVDLTKTSTGTATAPSVDVKTDLSDVLAALASAGDVAYVWDIESDAMTWHGSLQMLGFDAEIAIATGQAFAERINPDDLLQRQQQLHAHYARGQTFD